MGYDYIVIRANEMWDASEQNWHYWKDDTTKDGLKFYIYNPDEFKDIWSGTGTKWTRGWNELASHSNEQMIFYDSLMAWKNNNAWSGSTTNHYVSGWHHVAYTTYQLIPDYQQQAVVDYTVEGIMTEVGQLQNSGSVSFEFVGFQYDIARLFGDIHQSVSTATPNNQGTMAYWTGTDSSVLHGTITHEYVTHSSGRAAMYKSLFSRARNVYGTTTVHWVIEPWWLYHSLPDDTDEWLNHVGARSDWAQLQPDMYLSEQGQPPRPTDFVDGINNFNQTIPVTMSMTAGNIGKTFEESVKRLQVIAAGTAGAWMNWNQALPNGYDSITDVPDRMKVLSRIANMDNITLVGLSTSTTRFVGNDNGTISYHSVDTSNGSRWNSYISNQIYWVRNWKNTKTIFAAIGTNSVNGTITIAANEEFVSASYVDNLFQPTTVANDFVYNDLTKTLSLAGTVTVDWTGYILTLAAVVPVGDSEHTGGITTRSGGASTRY